MCRFPPVVATNGNNPKNGVQMALQAEEAFRSLQIGDKTAILQSAAAATTGTVVVLNTNGGSPPAANNTTNQSPSKEVTHSMLVNNILPLELQHHLFVLVRVENCNCNRVFAFAKKHTTH